MNPIKKMIIEETVSVLREVKNKKTIKKLNQHLQEAIEVFNAVKDNPKKNKIAKHMVSIREQKLLKELRNIKENHQYEDESEMAKAQLLSIIDSAKQLYKMIGNNVQLEDWVQYKLSIAENYMDAVHGYMKYFNGEDDMEDNTKNDMDDEMEWDDVEEQDLDDEFDDDDFGDEEYYDIEDFDEDDEGYYDDDEFEDDDELFT